MQNIVITMCEEFRDDRLRNDRALGDLKSDKQEPQQQQRSWPLETRFRVQKNTSIKNATG